MQDIYEKVLEKLVQEMSVGGVATPLGSGPKAGSRGEKVYKKQNATDKKHRSKGKSKKTYTRSVQWYLKNGGEKTRKRSFKEIHKLLLGELILERTDRLYDLTPDDVLSFLAHLRGDVQQETNFTMSEKISGQNTTVGILGTPQGRNMYYFALKDNLKKNSDVFNPKYMEKTGASSYIKSRFIRRYHRVKVLSPGEKITLGLEIIKPDREKPDYIAYNVAPKTTQVAVFSGPFDKNAANIMSGRGVYFLTPEDIAKTPAGKELLSQEVLEKLDELYELVQQNRHLAKKDFVPFVKQKILPQIRPHITAIFGRSKLNTSSPIEGIAVNMTTDQGSRFFKIHSEEFENVQQAQTSLYADFKTNRLRTNKTKEKFENSLSNQEFLNYRDSYGNYIRAGLLYDYVNDLGKQRSFRSFGFHIFSFIRKVSEMTHNQNTRVFVDPEDFQTLCSKLLTAINTNSARNYIDFVKFISSKIPRQRKGFQWHIVQGDEQFDCPEAQQIKNLNFDI